jgi:hypothetical protein
MKTIEKVVFDYGVILEKEDMLGLWMLSKHLLKAKVMDDSSRKLFSLTIWRQKN